MTVVVIGPMVVRYVVMSNLGVTVISVIDVNPTTSVTLTSSVVRIEPMVMEFVRVSCNVVDSVRKEDCDSVVEK